MSDNSTRHVLAQADAIKANADEVMALAAKNWQRMNDFAFDLVRDACGYDRPSGNVETRVFDPAEVFDAADDEAQREEAGNGE